MLAAIYGGRTLVMMRQFEVKQWLEMIEREQVILPGLIEELKQQALLDIAHCVGAIIGGLFRHLAIGSRGDALLDLLGVEHGLTPFSSGSEHGWFRKKSISPALSGIALQLRRCSVRGCTLHSSVFARLASGAFYETIVLLTFYDFIISHVTIIFASR
jgi:hypothetical protein